MTWDQSYHNISRFRQKCLDLEKDIEINKNYKNSYESWKTAWVFKKKTQALRPKFGLFYFSRSRQKISWSIYHMLIFLSPQYVFILRRNFLEARNFARILNELKDTMARFILRQYFPQSVFLHGAFLSTRHFLFLKHFGRINP